MIRGKSGILVSVKADLPPRFPSPTYHGIDLPYPCGHTTSNTLDHHTTTGTLDTHTTTTGVLD